MEKDLEVLRHSTAHLLAAAVAEMWPRTKFGIGPAIENGFYYDFEFPKKITEEDLPKIQKKMEEIKKNGLAFEQSKMKIAEALNFEKKRGQIYKEELIEQIQKLGTTSVNEGVLEKIGNKKTDTVSYYKLGNFIDLCRGPHVKTTKEIGYFKLLNLAGAYWRGSEKNPMLTRIYGTVFKTQKELEDYLSQIEEAKEWDHRKIGKELGLFVFSDIVGKGLPMFTAKGATIRRELERFIIDEEIKRGYQHVVTPALAKTQLYKISGHYPYYKDTMYPPMKIDEEELILRPMTCPHHFMLYKSQPRSYKELPIKYAELASQFRYEKSGELTGLMRVRMFCLADAHIFATPEQAETVIKEVLDLIDFTNKVLGLEKGVDYRYRLSLGDITETKKYFKDDKAWEKAEEVLRKVLTETKAPFFEAKNEAAFYGPKIDIQMKNAAGKEETAFTVQYDFALPKRFDLTCIDEKGKEKEVIVIHRSSIGAIERIMAFLIEKYKGAFPLWISPIQTVIIPIAKRHNQYALELKNLLLEKNLRVEVDSRNETMQTKIRNAQLQKIPYILVIGDREQVQKKVAIRSREKGDEGVVSISDLITRLKDEIENRK
jgi:threonyl-tRNA synthetase